MTEAITTWPWKIEIESGDRVLRSANGQALMCDMEYYPWTPSSQADWNLIAAAPEMLIALKAAADFIGSRFYAGRDNGIVYGQLHAAIDKAEGRC